MKIGEIIPKDREITLNEGKDTVTLKVVHTGDRPVQVGSHFHFFEVNRQLKFDREKAYGYHLDIPSGTSVRFEPGEEKEVQLTQMGGAKRIFGLNDLTCGQATEATKASAVAQAKLKGFIEC
jgi:urease beta subunit